MKRIVAFLLMAAMSMMLLVGCGDTTEETSSVREPAEIIGTVDQLHILLPYGTSETLVSDHAEQFCQALREEMEFQGWIVGDITVDVAATEAASGKALDDGTTDIVIMPASQYFTYSEDAKLLMTATKPGLSVQTTTANDWNGSVDSSSYTDEDCPYSRTLICTTKSQTGLKLAQSAKNGTLSWEELNEACWMYPEAVSSSDFFYPDLWLQKTFGKTMEELQNVVAVDGYGALFAEAGSGDADVIVIAADKRIDYADAWKLSADEMDYTGKLGLSHEDSIFNEIQVIGVTEAIYGDVMALRVEEGAFADERFQQALISAVDMLEINADARAIWGSCGYTGFTATSESNYDNIRELTVFGAGD